MLLLHAVTLSFFLLFCLLQAFISRKRISRMADMSTGSKSKKRAATFLPLEDKNGDSKRKKKTAASKEEKAPPAAADDFVPYSQSRGIVYMSHLPHGLYEKELRGFLAQFGAVTNLRVGRSKRTGASRGFAFVEFRYPEVAAIVAETMDNYLMFDKLVKCSLVPADRASRAVFRGKVNPSMPPGKKARIEAKREVNQLRTEEQNNRRLKRQLKRLEGLKKRLAEAGVESEVRLGKTIPTGATPVMEVDEEDADIKMKTPPNVRKVKSRSNSAVNSAAASRVRKIFIPDFGHDRK